VRSCRRRTRGSGGPDPRRSARRSRCHPAPPRSVEDDRRETCDSLRSRAASGRDRCRRLRFGCSRAIPIRRLRGGESRSGTWTRSACVGAFRLAQECRPRRRVRRARRYGASAVLPATATRDARQAQPPEPEPVAPVAEAQESCRRTPSGRASSLRLQARLQVAIQLSTTVTSFGASGRSACTMRKRWPSGVTS